MKYVLMAGELKNAEMMIIVDERLIWSSRRIYLSYVIKVTLKSKLKELDVVTVGTNSVIV